MHCVTFFSLTKDFFHNIKKVPASGTLSHYGNYKAISYSIKNALPDSSLWQSVFFYF